MDSKSISSRLSNANSLVGAARKEEEVKDKDDQANQKTDLSTKNWSVQLSPQSKALSTARQKAVDIAQSTSDIRQDRIDELKAKISSGEYKIDPEKIADGILKEAIRDHLANDSGLMLEEM